MRYYLAGGAVRDILLGLVPHEFDIVFDGTVKDFLLRYPNAVRVGKATPVFIVDGYEYMPLYDTIQKDLIARDLTINALLMADTGRIHALPETFDDLRNGRIRHVSACSFPADPVRVFRAARFSATLPGFSIVPETLHHMRQTAALPAFATIAPERVGKECIKAMSGHTPGNFFRSLARADSLSPWFCFISTHFFPPHMKTLEVSDSHAIGVKDAFVYAIPKLSHLVLNILFNEL